MNKLLYYNLIQPQCLVSTNEPFFARTGLRTYYPSKHYTGEHCESGKQPNLPSFTSVSNSLHLRPFPRPSRSYLYFTASSLAPPPPQKVSCQSTMSNSALFPKPLAQAQVPLAPGDFGARATATRSSATALFQAMYQSEFRQENVTDVDPSPGGKEPGRVIGRRCAG